MSDMSYDLKKMADMEKQEVNTAAPDAPVDPDGFVPLGAPVGVESLNGVGAPVIILPGDPVSTEEPSTTANSAGINTSAPNMPQLLNPSDLMADESSSEITEDDLRTVMPDLDDAAFMSIAKDMKINLSNYQKSLVINNGFTPEEALLAAKKKLEKDGHAENTKWLEKNPNVGIVRINKQSESTINFTPEEKEKLNRVKSIQLVVCEDMDLKSIPIKKVSREAKSEILKMTDFNLAKYSIPLPIYGDFMSFKGAQIVQLASAVDYEDSKIEDIIGRKGYLLYDRLIGGQVMIKYGMDHGKKVTDLTYADFIKEFPFYDLDMGMFGILCASSAEEAKTHLTCYSCKTGFEWTYNVKALLNMENNTDDWKERIDTILGHKSNQDVLLEIHSSSMKTIRYKSPFSNHIYDISQPSIADAIRIYGNIDNQEDQNYMNAAQLALFIRTMFVYTPDDETYIPINDDPTVDETAILLENLQAIPQNDVNMISQVASKMVYNPRFILNSKCPVCGNQMQNPLRLDEMIFLVARDLFTETVL